MASFLQHSSVTFLHKPTEVSKLHSPFLLNSFLPIAQQSQHILPSLSHGVLPRNANKQIPSLCSIPSVQHAENSIENLQLITIVLFDLRENGEGDKPLVVDFSSVMIGWLMVEQIVTVIVGLNEMNIVAVEGVMSTSTDVERTESLTDNVNDGTIKVMSELSLLDEIVGLEGITDSEINALDSDRSTVNERTNVLEVKVSVVSKVSVMVGVTESVITDFVSDSVDVSEGTIWIVPLVTSIDEMIDSEVDSVETDSIEVDEAVVVSVVRTSVVTTVSVNGRCD